MDVIQKKNSGLHKGHRQRLKGKVKDNSLKVLNEHEILELMLMYSIPQKDTNELAHRLINKYGSLYNVFMATREELMTNNGIKDESSLYLNILGQLHLYLLGHSKNAPIKLNNIQQCMDYFHANLGIGKNECAYLVFTNDKDEFVRLEEFSNGTNFDIELDKGELGAIIAKTKAKNVILFHTHPYGPAKPSTADLLATQSLMNICYMLNVKLVDHIIVNHTETYSFRRQSLLTEMEKIASRKSTLSFNDPTLQNLIDLSNKEIPPENYYGN